MPLPSDADVTQRAGSVRAMTGGTAPALTALLPPFEHALAASRQGRTIDGPPRTSRRYSPDDHGPLATRADPQLFMRTSVKPHPIHERPGPLFGMSPSKANQWSHLLHAVLNHALAQQELRPARNAAE